MHTYWGMVGARKFENRVGHVRGSNELATHHEQLFRGGGGLQNGYKVCHGGHCDDSPRKD